MTLGEALGSAFLGFEARPAVLAPGKHWTYGQLAEAVRGRVSQLSGMGLVPGERVAAYLANGPEFFELSLACAIGGWALVPLNTRLSARELAGILERAQPRVLAGAEELGSTLQEALLERARADSGASLLHLNMQESAPPPAVGSAITSELPSPESVAQIYFTSGTTGRPKGVPLRQRHVLAHAQAALREFQLNESDVWGHFAPMFHLADAWAVFAVTLAGGAHCFLPRFDPADCFACIEEHGVTLTNLVPTMLQRMVAQEGPTAPTTSMRMVLSGGAPIAPELVRRVQARFGCEYVQTYGLTETSPFLTVSRLDEDLRQLDEERRFFYASRTGRAFGGIELRLVSESGEVLPTDGASVGEIQARGPWVFDGYWQDQGATREVFDGDWFRTGDLATCEERGFFQIVDRKKDIILSGGETVYSTEVENALYTHQLVQSAAVFAMRDDTWGEVVAAAIVRAPAGDKRLLQMPELIAHCRLFLASYKLPRIVYFVEEFPLTGSGKIQKRLLRERCVDLTGERLSS